MMFDIDSLRIDSNRKILELGLMQRLVWGLLHCLSTFAMDREAGRDLRPIG